MEAERELIAQKIKIVDKNLDEMKDDIIEKLKNESAVARIEANEKIKKQCKFNKKGYCREKK